MISNIKFLYHHSKTGSCDEVAVLCMEVLANMCRHSASVRAHIKGQVNCIELIQLVYDIT